VLAQVEQVGPTDATILVQGETGTGKELVVHAIHAASRRHDRTLVKQDGPRLGRSVRAVSAETLEALRAYRWPGNVRELRNVTTSGFRTLPAVASWKPTSATN
jgi:transcriptional regulator with GAF, ATPase, and Fis domain